MLSRRAALRSIFGTAAMACPLCQAGGAHATSTPQSSYDSHQGREAWAKLSPEWRACSDRIEESPVDLKDAIKAELGLLSFAYKRMPVRIVNNGHTIQVNCPTGSQAQIGRETYDLIQYHFHHPSEHILAGQRFELELHLVHRDKSGHLAVIGVFIRSGAANAALQSLWTVLPPKAGPEKWTSVTLNPDRLLPANSSYYRYYGSLTTPPCSDGVLWTMFKEPLQASEAQIRQFAQLYPNNSRPVQPVNRRFLLQSGY